MKITASQWLMSQLNFYRYPVKAFRISAAAGCSAVANELNIYLYSVTYNGVANTILVVFTIDPNTCNTYFVPLCGYYRFDNPSNLLSVNTGLRFNYWCTYAFYEQITFIGAN